MNKKQILSEEIWFGDIERPSNNYPLTENPLPIFTWKNPKNEIIIHHPDKTRDPINHNPTFTATDFDKRVIRGLSLLINPADTAFKIISIFERKQRRTKRPLSKKQELK